MNGRDVVRLVLPSAPRRPIVTMHAHRTSGAPLRVNCSCATRTQLRGPLLSVKNASPCADLELATHSRSRANGFEDLRRCGMPACSIQNAMTAYRCGMLRRALPAKERLIAGF